MWLDPPTLIRYSGCPSVLPRQDFWEDVLSGVGRPPDTQPHGYLRTRFPGPTERQAGQFELKETKGRTTRKGKKESQAYRQIIRNRWSLNRSINFSWERKVTLPADLKGWEGEERPRRLSPYADTPRPGRALQALGPFLSVSISFPAWQEIWSELFPPTTHGMGSGTGTRESFPPKREKRGTKRTAKTTTTKDRPYSHVSLLWAGILATPCTNETIFWGVCFF